MIEIVRNSVSYQHWCRNGLQIIFFSLNFEFYFLWIYFRKRMRQRHEVDLGQRDLPQPPYIDRPTFIFTSLWPSKVSILQRAIDWYLSTCKMLDSVFDHVNYGLLVRNQSYFWQRINRFLERKYFLSLNNEFSCRRIGRIWWADNISDWGRAL